jgi:hypothetical protein
MFTVAGFSTGDAIQGNCPMCGDNNWSETEDSLYVPRESISAPGFGLSVLTFVCGTCNYVLLIKRPT